MPSHWAYKDPTPTDTLEQGDVLKLTDGLIDLLRNYHPFYAEHRANRFYIVLTQSCDLVRRAGGIKSRYIAIAPVRPLTNIVEYEFKSQIKTVDEVLYGSGRVESEVEKFLERLFNNNESSYFYLEPETAHGLSEPMCAMLPLGIAFKAEHFQTFLDAKVLGLDDSFQAKLGWLLGQSYSRVGTRDFEPSIVAERAKAHTKTLGLWVEAAKYSAFEKEIKRLKQASADPITLDVVGALIPKLPTRKGQAVDAVIDVAIAQRLLPEGRSSARFEFRRAMEQDPTFADLFRE